MVTNINFQPAKMDFQRSDLFVQEVKGHYVINTTISRCVSVV